MSWQTEVETHQQYEATKSLSVVLYDAAWELCVRGLLRPGVTEWNAQSIGDHAYSLTSFGKRWLNEAPTEPIIVTDPGRVSTLLKQVHGRFGHGFFQRGSEAVRCYQAHAFLATCVMCGAAAESILLSLAIAKCGDEAQVLSEYASSKGRSRIENRLLGQADARMKARFDSFLGLLKDWRDESAHGVAVSISSDEAATALDLLVRFALFADREWPKLVGDPALA